MSMPIPCDARVSVVVLTYNRRREVLRTVQRLSAQCPGVPVIVVDNASRDGTAEALEEAFPGITVLRAPRNQGAAGRNLGCQAARTPYVAFCDDDTCWEPGALERAADMLDAHPRLALLSARIRVGDEGRPDPACAVMAASPLPGIAGVGPGLVGYMAGACVVRRAAFLGVGGYWRPFFIGGEESLVALDLLQAGWQLAYAPDVETRHWPSQVRDASGRRRLLARNAVWLAWLRLPLGLAWRETWTALRQLPKGTARWRVAGAALSGLPRVMARRRVLAPEVLARWRAVRSQHPAGQGAGRESAAAHGTAAQG